MPQLDTKQLPESHCLTPTVTRTISLCNRANLVRNLPKIKQETRGIRWITYKNTARDGCRHTHTGTVEIH